MFNIANYNFHLLSDDPFGEPQMLKPIFNKGGNHGPVQRSSETNSNTQADNVSRIIPIQVEKGAGAFKQSNHLENPASEPSFSLNTLQELQQHQSANRAEESIRGFTKPKVNQICCEFNSMKEYLKEYVSFL